MWFLTVAAGDGTLQTHDVGAFFSHVLSQIGTEPIHFFLKPVNTVLNTGQPGHQLHNGPDQIRPNGQQRDIGWDQQIT
jgi:hypothetical protein